MPWGAIASALGGLSSNLLGSKDSGGASRPGFLDTGWTGEEDGIVRRGPFGQLGNPFGVHGSPGQSQNMKQDQAGWFNKTNEFLGTEIGQIGRDIFGGLVSDSRMRRNTRKHMEFLESKGLTPWEVAGSGGAGGAVTSQGNTLGNGPQRQAVTQQQHERWMQERELQSREKVARIGAEAPLKQANATIEMLQHRKMLTFAQAEQASATALKLGEEFQIRQLERKYYWQNKIATMGRDNVMASLAMRFHGLSGPQILADGSNLSEEGKKQLRLLWRDLNNPNSVAYKEFEGVLSVIGKTVTDEETLGNVRGLGK